MSFKLSKNPLGLPSRRGTFRPCASASIYEYHGYFELKTDGGLFEDLFETALDILENHLVINKKARKFFREYITKLSAGFRVIYVGVFIEAATEAMGDTHITKRDPMACLEGILDAFDKLHYGFKHDFIDAGFESLQKEAANAKT